MDCSKLSEDFDSYNEARTLCSVKSNLVNSLSRHAYNAITRDSALQMSRKSVLLRSARVEGVMRCVWVAAGVDEITNRELGTVNILRAGSDVSKLIRGVLENDDDAGAKLGSRSRTGVLKAYARNSHMSPVSAAGVNEV